MFIQIVIEAAQTCNFSDVGKSYDARLTGKIDPFRSLVRFLASVDSATPISYLAQTSGGVENTSPAPHP
eukprot:754061-Hanusia_phi.AAC.2